MTVSKRKQFNQNVRLAESSIGILRLNGWNDERILSLLHSGTTVTKFDKEAIEFAMKKLGNYQNN